MPGSYSPPPKAGRAKFATAEEPAMLVLRAQKKKKKRDNEAWILRNMVQIRTRTARSLTLDDKDPSGTGRFWSHLPSFFVCFWNADEEFITCTCFKCSVLGISPRPLGMNHYLKRRLGALCYKYIRLLPRGPGTVDGASRPILPYSVALIAYRHGFTRTSLLSKHYTSSVL